VAGLALLTAEGGHDEQRTALATQDQRAEGGAAPSALAAVPTVGDYGDLDRAANVDALRRALTGAAGPSASSAAGPASSREADRTSSTAAASPVAGCPSALDALGAATVLAQGSGTLDGRPVVVVLSSRADGTRSIDAITGPPACSVRHLANP
jgi:hypothetical protein